MAFGDVINLQGDASDLLNEMNRAAQGFNALGTTIDSFARKWTDFQAETANIQETLGKKGTQEYVAELKGRIRQLELAAEKELQANIKLAGRLLNQQVAKHKKEEAEREKSTEKQLQQSIDDAGKLLNAQVDAHEKELQENIAAAGRLLNAQAKAGEKREAEEKKANEKTITEAERTARRLLRIQQRDLEAAERAEQQANIREAKRRLRERNRGMLQGEANEFLTGAEKSLGGIPTGATKQGLVNVATAKAQVEGLILRGRVSKERMQELFDQIRRGKLSFDNLTESERKAEVALRRLTRSFENLGTAGKRTQEVLLSWRSVIRLQQIQLLHYGISATVRAMEDATRAGAEFKVKIAEIQTISQRNQQTVGEWSTQLIGLSNAFDLELLDATSAAYEAISNQIAEGARITPFLTSAFQFARTTSSSAMESVNLLSSAINGFNLAAFQTDQTAAQLFKTIEVGRVRTEQIANIFGNSIPMANALGVSLAEINAGLATLTKQGTRPDTSLTLMNNIMLKLVKPSSEMIELFKEWGVESGEAAIATYGFFGVLQKFAKEAEKGGLTRIAEIAQDMRAIRGLIGNIGGGAFKDYEESLNAIKNAQDDYTKATEIMAENSGTALKRIRREIDNTLTKEMSDKIGQLILAFESDSGQSTIFYVKELAGAVSNLANITAATITPFAGMRLELSAILPTLVGYYAGMKATAFVTGLTDIASSNYTSTINKLNTTSVASLTSLDRMKASLGLLEVSWDGNYKRLSLFSAGLGLLKANAVPIAVAGLTYLIAKHYEYQNTLSTMADDISESYRKANEKRLKQLDNTLARELVLIQDQTKSTISEYNKLLALQNKVIQSLGPKQSLEEIIALEEIFAGNLSTDVLPAIDAVYKRMDQLTKVGRQFAQTGGLSEAEKIFERVAKYAGDTNDKIRAALKLIDDETKQIGKSQQDSALERALFGKTDINKAKIITAEITKLMAATKDKGATDLPIGFGMEELKRAEQLASRLLGMQDEKKAKKAGPVFELQSSIYAEQLRIQELMTEQLKMRELGELTIVEANRKLLKEQQEADEKRKQSQQEVQNQLKDVDDKIKDVFKRESQSESDLVSTGGDFAGKLQQAAEAMIGSMLSFERNPLLLVTKQQQALGKNVKAPELKQQFQEIMKLQEELRIAQQTGDAKTVVTRSKQLQDEYKQIKELLYVYDTLTEGQAVFGSKRDSFKRLLQDLNEAEIKLKNAQGAPADLEVQKTQLLQERERLNALVTNESAKLTALAAQYPDIMAALTSANAAANNEAERTVQLINALKNSTGQNAANIDGLRGMATGGRHGRDNLVGRFSPNEMVMNPQATARFGPTLSAMNMSGRANTSSSSIVNVGDINVTANAGPSGKLDISSLGRDIRRAVQRKEITLR